MEPVSPAYESEGGVVRYVAVESESVDEEDGSVGGNHPPYEGFRLGDGSWSEPTPLFDEDVDAAFPFMLSDGCTFYFASRSEQGLGGYDIFRSYRDSDTGEFQNPVNMGLPYNSPADDYMLAIDEYTGAGWWATDRNGAVDENGDELVTHLCVRALRDARELRRGHSRHQEPRGSVDPPFPARDPSG